ncbi:uncharacterized protein FOBCDRAFT_139106 [Fusarium oxysporum Fo47]|uniref:uncharacterized protein n=1 Tax=Fusarium oxysporum Fo47 TaxID=660027 RepID=UPI002869C3E8|nr:uncharacterized protein FOBCDRAFT_139106 [Fusarium oxysporum Fo47]QKD57058.2 hypothetical protein FOBCDRAFT_139106 [Fusarium oxysporum Fo47]
MCATGTICSSIFTRQAVPPTSSNPSVLMQQSPDAGGPLRQSTFPAVSDEVPPEDPAPLVRRRLFSHHRTRILLTLSQQCLPAMCHPSCNDINSPRREWIEWDSQILNALFCVTGFGLAPWRFRDLWFLFQYQVQGKEISLRRLGGIHRGWFRLPGSAELDPKIGPENVSSSPHLVSSIACPYPRDKIPDAPLTGQRAPATPIWKSGAVIWLMVWNTFFQCCLAGFMWGMNRYNRPSWATGLFVGLGCMVAAVGGIIIFIEGKKVKGIKGVLIGDKDIQQLQEDREKGIWHYNNIKDKDLTEDAKKNKVAKK